MADFGVFVGFKYMRNMNNKDLTGLREHPRGKSSEKPYHMSSILNRLFPDENWIHNKGIRGSNGKCYRRITGGPYQPDFRNEDKKIIIEIDGSGGNYHKHYCEPKQTHQDIEDTKFYESIGYKVIRIPMYIQLDREMLNYYFGIDYKGAPLYDAASAHGFLHSQIALPAEFCKEGIERFTNEMKSYPTNVRNTIIATLHKRIEDLTNTKNDKAIAKSLVLPPELYFLLDENS